MGLIREMAREFRVPVLCNIHDVQLATEFCNRIIGLQDGIKMFDGPTATMTREDLDEIYEMEVL
jgi:phosphonate transport system ATP-binding protein